MKLAEALSESKRLSNLIPTLQTQFQENCIIINGVKPDRDPEKLLTKIYDTIATRHALDKQVSMTNTQVVLPCGLTIHEAIIRKAELKSLIASTTYMYNALRTGKRTGLYSETGVVKTYAVRPDSVEAKGNEAAKELRQIESQLQQCNWVQDLI